jgi:hypothetical protein
MSLAENITRHFRGDWHGSYGLIPTRDHGPKDRGTKVRDSADGRDVVFHSFNGGDWRALKDDCRQAGLIPTGDDQRAPQGRSRDVATWEYTNAEGSVLYRKVRMALANGDKSYRVEHPDGHGGWTKGRGGNGTPASRLARQTSSVQ